MTTSIKLRQSTPSLKLKPSQKLVVNESGADVVETSSGNVVSSFDLPSFVNVNSGIFYQFLPKFSFSPAISSVTGTLIVPNIPSSSDNNLIIALGLDLATIQEYTLYVSCVWIGENNSWYLQTGFAQSQGMNSQYTISQSELSSPVKPGESYNFSIAKNNENGSTTYKAVFDGFDQTSTSIGFSPLLTSAHFFFTSALGGNCDLLPRGEINFNNVFLDNNTRTPPSTTGWQNFGGSKCNINGHVSVQVAKPVDTLNFNFTSNSV